MVGENKYEEHREETLELMIPFPALRDLSLFYK